MEVVMKTWSKLIVVTASKEYDRHATQGLTGAQADEQGEPVCM